MRMYQVYDVKRPEFGAYHSYFATFEQAEEHIGNCTRYDREHPEETGGIPGYDYLGIRIVERPHQPCVVCGAEAQNKPEAYAEYPYCRSCHYTGSAAEHQHAADLEAFQVAFPDAVVGVEHTGGGCFWLAFRWQGNRAYYCATAGEAEVPDDDRWDDGWGIVCRYRDEDDDQGEVLAWADVYGDQGDPTFLSKQQVIDAIAADIASREAVHS